MKIRNASFLFAALALAAPTNAQVLRSHEANSGLASSQSGIFFNLSAIGGNDLSISGFDFHTWSPGTAVDVTLYTKRGGFEGHTAHPTAWTNLGTTTVPWTSGLGASDFVDTPDFAVNTGETTGVYFFIETNGIGYASSAMGSFRGRFINDTNLMLEAGVSRNALFGGSKFGMPSGGSFRGFAGSIYYNAIPEPGGAVILSLAGLGFIRRRR